MSYDPTVLGPLSLFELIWIAIFLGGLPYGVRNFMRSYEAYQVAKEPPVDKFEVEIAKLFRAIQSAIMVTQWGALLLGGMWAFQPPPQIDVDIVQYVVGTVIFMAGAVVLNWLSYYISRVQTRAMRGYAQRRDELAAIAEQAVEEHEERTQTNG